MPRRVTGSSDTSPADAGWLRNFAAILVCQAFIFMGFSSVYPFLPLYLQDLGEDEAGAMVWTGIIQAAGSAVLLVATPLWGVLADRVGNKPMVLRALLASGGCLAGMGLATQAWHLLVLRSLQGATAGTNSAVLALAAGVLPSARLGVGMGLLQTAQFLGSSLGPLLGSVASSTFGFRATFGIAGASIVFMAVVVAVFVREPAKRSAAATERRSVVRDLALVSRAPRLRAPILAIFAFQASYAVSLTLLPLHVAKVAGDDALATTWLGVVLMAAALGVASGAAVLGWLGGRFGERRAALFSLGATAVLVVPQAWFTDPLQFVALRALLGFCAGGVLPSLRATLGHEAQRDDQMNGHLGAMYGMAQSAFSGGLVVGPVLASLVAAAFGLPATHVVSGAMQAIATVWYWHASVGGTAQSAASAVAAQHA